MHEMPPKRNHIAHIAIFSIIALFLMIGTFWAGIVVGKQRFFPEKELADPIFVTATEQSVGKVFTLSVTVLQESVAISQNLLEGVLTRVSLDESYEQGDVVYEVDGVPVKVIQGNSPFYRDLSEGSFGEDVQQLNDALTQMGYLSEGGTNYSTWTAEAVRKWQRDTGVAVTGVVERGSLVAVPTLPATLTVDTTDYQVGAILAGGENLILAPSTTPEFQMPVTPNQEQSIPLGAKVEVFFEDNTWEGEVTGADNDANGNRMLILSGLDGKNICGDQCTQLPQGENLTLMGTVQVVPEVSGIAVPVAALRVQPNGKIQVEVQVDGAQSSVTDPKAKGALTVTELCTVSVLASQDGIAIVEGISAGDKVLLFGIEDLKKVPLADGTNLPFEDPKDKEPLADSKDNGS